MTKEAAPTYSIDDCADVPLELRRGYMQCAKHYGVSYYYLCEIYRKGKVAGQQQSEHRFTPSTEQPLYCESCGASETDHRL